MATAKKVPTRLPPKRPPAKPTTPKKAASGPRWPHDHASKHSVAARKGWAHRRGAGSQVAKFGGSSTHTEKTHYLKPRKKAAPKKPTTRAAAPAAPDTYELIATQKSNGKWIITRRYKSGRIVQQPGEYASNPLKGRTRQSRQVKGQSALFGGEYEREKTYGRGLFG